MRTPSYLAVCLVSCLSIIAACASGPVIADANHVENYGKKDHWSYDGETGPAHWASLSSKYRMCGEGTRQSPIDIVRPHIDVLGINSPIAFHYDDVHLSVVNTGHSIQVNNDSDAWIRIRANQYRLHQLHLHAPSEHTIDGQSFPLELHLVHNDPQGIIAVVGILIREGEHNPALEEIFNHAQQGSGEAVEIVPIAIFSQLFPEDHSHFSYEGSLTTPPCGEGVQWHVFSNAIEASVEQIQHFHQFYDHNSRPVQPLNGRRVLKYKAD